MELSHCAAAIVGVLASFHGHFVYFHKVVIQILLFLLFMLIMTPTKSIAISLPYFCLLPINIDCIIIDYYIIDFCLLEDLIFCHIFHLETNKYCKH